MNQDRRPPDTQHENRPVSQSAKTQPQIPRLGQARHRLFYHSKRSTSSFTGALLCGTLFIFLIVISLFVIVQSQRNMQETQERENFSTAITTPLETFAFDPSVTTAESQRIIETSDENFIGPPAPLNTPEHNIVTVPTSDVHRGDLILVNYEYPYVFPEEQKLTQLYGNKSPVYVLSGINLYLDSEIFPFFDKLIVDFVEATGCKNQLMVTSGYRSYSDQEELYKQRVARDGEEKTALYVAKPGNSEHHIGYAIDMVMYVKNTQYYFPNYPQASWIIENAPDYGFFLRYTDEKQSITQCAAEPWHYRYVGAPHARLITEMGLCFEEYHEFLRQYTWEGKRLLIKWDGKQYSETDGWTLPPDGFMVYYVPADAGDITEIPVPPDLDYRISGDNINGFIVTVTLG